MKPKYIAITVITLIILSGCSHAVEDYPSAVMWNDEIYYGSGDMITKEEVGMKIGEIRKNVSTFPKNEGESNQYLAATTIYEVKGRSKNKTIAIEENAQYRVFNKE